MNSFKTDLKRTQIKYNKTSTGYQRTKTLATNQYCREGWQEGKGARGGRRKYLTNCFSKHQTLQTWYIH
jgi:hypothetical protein